MPLSVGTRLGPYEILSALGAGGMGEVYRATDTNLKRQVAIKVLPDIEQHSGCWLDRLVGDCPARRKTESFAEYARSGYLVFIRQGNSMAQPFDAGKLAVSGSAFVLADGVSVSFQSGAGSFSVSADGALAYRAGPNSTRLAQLRWYDRAGIVLSTVGEPTDYLGIEMAADDRHLAVHAHENIGGGDIWIRDLERGTNTRLTAVGHNTGPVFPQMERPSRSARTALRSRPRSRGIHTMTTVSNSQTGEKLFDSLAPSVGGGLRLLSKRSRTYLCFDLAWGKDGAKGVYLAIQDAPTGFDPPTRKVQRSRPRSIWPR